MKLQRLLPLLAFLTIFSCGKENSDDLITQQTNDIILAAAESDNSNAISVHDIIKKKYALSFNPIQPNNIQPGQFNRYVVYPGEGVFFDDVCPSDAADTCKFTVTNETFVTPDGYTAFVISETFISDAYDLCLLDGNDTETYEHLMYVISNYNNSGIDHLIIEKKPGTNSLMLLPTQVINLPLITANDCSVIIDPIFPFGELVDPGCTGAMYASDTEVQNINYPHLNYVEDQLYIPVSANHYFAFNWNSENGIVLYSIFGTFEISLFEVRAHFELLP